MGINKPHTRFIIFSILSIIELGFVINSLRKGIDLSSFGDWLDSLLLMNCTLAFSFFVQAWCAYKETKKIKGENVE